MVWLIWCSIFSWGSPRLCGAFLACLEHMCPTACTATRARRQMSRSIWQQDYIYLCQEVIYARADFALTPADSWYDWDHRRQKTAAGLFVCTCMRGEGDGGAKHCSQETFSFSLKCMDMAHAGFASAGGVCGGREQGSGRAGHPSSAQGLLRPRHR